MFQTKHIEIEFPKTFTPPYLQRVASDIQKGLPWYLACILMNVKIE